MKEKANYPKNNNTNKKKIDHFLAFRRKAKIAYISTDNAMAILRNQECAQYVRSGVYLKKQSNLRGPDFMSYNNMTYG